MMRWVDKLRLRWRSLLRRPQVEQEISDELRFHLEQQVEEYIAAGMGPEEARYAARRSIGGTEQIKEECRDMRRVNFVEDLGQDLRYAGRILRNSPVFTTVVILTLTFGIGANTAIFSVLYGIWLAPLSYSAPSRLADIGLQKLQGEHLDFGSSVPNVLDWRIQDRLFVDFGIHQSVGRANITGVGEAEEIIPHRVAANLFPLLGVSPIIGQHFSHEADRSGGPHLALMSYAYWANRFGGNPAVVGRRFFLNGRPFTVAGVMPKGFEFPPDALSRSKPVLWLSLNLPPEELSNRAARDMYVVGRLKPGVSLATAQSEMAAIQARLAAAYPAENGCCGVRVMRMDSEAVEWARPSLLLLMAAAFMVQLIACVNIAGLQIARSAMRRREFAVRLAMGVTRIRLVSQLLTENCLLSVCGAALGTGAAFWCIDPIKALLPGELPRVTNIAVHPAVLLFSVCCALVSGMLFGLLPALQASTVNADEALKHASRSIAPRNKILRPLVASEIVLAFVLLDAGGLFIESLRNLNRVDLGFDLKNVLTARVQLPQQTYDSGRKMELFREQLLSRVRALPGVEYAGTVSALPLGNLLEGTDFEIEGQPGLSKPFARYANVSTGYLEAMGIRLVSGRYLGQSDWNGTAPAAIVSESLARHYLAGGGLGAHIRIERTQRQDWFTVVGVVRDVRQFGPEAQSEPAVYVLNSQLPEREKTALTWLNVLVVRTARDPYRLVRSVRRVVAEIDPNQPLADISTMQEKVDRSTRGHRLNAILLGSFSALALLLAAIGVFGLVSYVMASRTREIGIRLALGATPAGVTRETTGSALKMAVAALAIGGFLAILSTRLIKSFLFGVNPVDGITLVAAQFVLVVAVLVGAYLPACRASRVDPVVALRYE